MYECIHIRNATMLGSLASMLAVADPEHLPTHRTSMLAIKKFGTTDVLSAWDAVHVIMCAVSAIRYFDLREVVPSSVMSALALHSRDTLQTLYLVFQHPADLGPINHLRALLTLIITRYSSYDEDTQPFDGSKRLAIPTLLRFTYICYGSISDHMLSLIATFRFHSTCALEFIIPFVRKEHSTLLQPLFENHRPNMVRIRGVLGFVPSLLACTDELRLESVWVPSHELFQVDGPLPSDIFFSVWLMDTVFDSLWAAFAALGERAAPMPPRAVRIHIVAEDLTFTWAPRADINAEEALFFAHAVRHAIALAPHGISLLDEDGKDMPTLFSAVSA
jgi:hypothetical protein